MMSKRIGFALCALAAGMSVAMRAQAPAATTTANDAIAALVTEVRALRADLSQVAAASMRSQLLVTRIQLQEQRLMHLDRQRTEGAAKLAETEKVRTMFAAQVKALERDMEKPAGEVPEAQRRDIENVIGGMRAQLQTAQASEAALRSEQDALLNALSTEQSRWSDFNNRLDELERALPKTSGR